MFPTTEQEVKKERQHGFTTQIRLEQLWTDLARDNVGMFIEYMTDGERPPANHHKDWLYYLVHPAYKRVLIIASREFAKSHIAVYHMAWYIGHNPKTTNIITSVASKQAKERMENLRGIMELPRYKNVFPHIHIDNSRKDTQTEFSVWSDKWNPADPNAKVMSYQAWRSLYGTHYNFTYPTIKIAGLTSREIIGSRISGLGLIDDPQDEISSATEEMRQKTVKLIKTNILNSAQKDAKVVIITTRWAETDVAATMKEQKKANGTPVWKTIETPAINEQGESNWPELWPLERLQDKREEVGEIMFQTQYLNNPFGASSGMFEMKHLVKDLPEPLPDFDKIIISTDLASAKTAGADWTVICLIARDNRKPFGMYILDGVRVKVNFDEGINLAAKKADEWFEIYKQLDGIIFEVPASRAAAQTLKLKRLDLPIVEVPTKGDKAIRLESVALKAQGGNLYINQKLPFIQAVYSELIGFPKASKDDICDCFSLPLQQVNWSTGTGSGYTEIKSSFLI